MIALPFQMGLQLQGIPSELGRMSTLYHISEEPDIKRFEPRMPPTENPAVQSPVVWAVAKTHLANYLLPRQCPRVAFRATPGASELDRNRFLGPGCPEHVVAIESRWFEYATNCTLWLYEFSPETFVCADATAGYFVSSVAVAPVSSRCVKNPLSELLGSGVELRVVPSLLALASDVASSTLAFSCIRMRNAGVGPDSNQRRGNSFASRTGMDQASWSLDK
jgi:hypothetical protein